MVEIIFDSGNGIRQVFEGGTLTFQVKEKSGLGKSCSRPQLGGYPQKSLFE
jgi:hypothetical protein